VYRSLDAFLSAYSFRWFIVAENTIHWFIMKEKHWMAADSADKSKRTGCLSFWPGSVHTSHRDGPSDPTWRLALLACTRGVRGAESRAEQQRVALLTRYPTRTRRPLWPSCKEPHASGRARSPWPWARKRVGPPSDGAAGLVYAGQVQRYPMPCVTLAAGSTTRGFHEVFMQVIYSTCRSHSSSILYSSGTTTTTIRNGPCWVREIIRGFFLNRDMPFLSGDLAH
jgi:hypothetical protein